MTDAAPSAEHDGLLMVVKNLSQYHREHEKYYSEASLAGAISLQRMARTLIALAERWSSVEPAAEPVASPFAGAPDLNDDRAIETSGVLFMEGGGEPAEIARIKSELETMAVGSEQVGSARPMRLPASNTGGTGSHWRSGTRNAAAKRRASARTRRRLSRSRPPQRSARQ